MGGEGASSPPLTRRFLGRVLRLTTATVCSLPPPYVLGSAPLKCGHHGTEGSTGLCSR